MPDATGGLAAGIYWIVTGRLPIEDLKRQEELEKESKDLRNQRDKKVRR
jgi:hypothetical protein